MMFVPFLQTKSLKTNNFDLCLYQLQSFKCFKVLNVCTSFMALRGWCVCGRPKRALRLARAGRRYLYARALVHLWGEAAPLCTQSGGGASERARRHYWTPAALAVAPGANINYSCSGESSCCQATGCERNSASCKLGPVHNFWNLLPNYFQLEGGQNCEDMHKFEISKHLHS